MIDGVALNERKSEMKLGRLVKLIGEQMNEVTHELNETLAA